ncbi:TonB-linked outer membrane protein, SusC/RagA family [Sphingobacterium wenxiniae]|uniref:TonB-linked outer membrane protein, SusC/RagA family n=1 Tax=Sphingobacterium wenxiniae TaxID=683125 RepID=A0A1I6R4R4_9SPHI|nr:TonB-linked outer membrane protein, SusC/RagA family [Sphingobacterium wenxiniae]
MTSAEGTAVSGATVTVKNSSVSTSTDDQGNFSITVDRGQTLVITAVGFSQVEKVVDGAVLSVVIQESSQDLDEVVVVGYGVQKKVNMTGSVASVGSDKLESRPMANLSSGLGGLASGVQVRQGSGRPGSDGAGILVRGTGTFQGSNSPMVVIDGVVVDEGNAINAINPEDVASISILKDAASAAIYGSRAANGVILITTKGGRLNTAPKVSYSSLFAQTNVSSKFSIESNTAEWMDMHNRATANLNPVGVTNDPTLLPYKQSDIDIWRAASSDPNGTNNPWGVPNYLAYPNTDWTEYFYYASFYHKHTVQASGGSENSTYLLSAGYQANPGTMPNTSLDEYSIRANVETKVANFLKIGTRTYFNQRYGDVADPTTDGALYYINQMVPAMTPIHDGKYGALEDPTLNAAMNPMNMENPLARLILRDGKNITSRLNTTWYVNAELIKGLNAEVRFNYQDAIWDKKGYDVNVKRYSFRTGEPLAEYNGNLSLATTSKSFTRQIARNLIGTLNYMKTFGDHDVAALAGYEQTYWNYNGFNATRRGLLDYSLTDITTGIEMASIGGDYERDYSMISQFARVNYAYKGKYLFEGNVRRDGSSRFAPDHRYGVFPSVSVGRRLSEESFFQPLKNAVDDFKIRGSWGQLGNVTSSYYAWQALYASTNVVLNGTETKGLYPSQLPNTLLTWEHVTSSNLGFDAAFLKHRLNLEFDVYSRLTEGILTTPVAYSTRGDITIPMENSASMRNNGFEITTSWRDKIGNVRYGVTGNFSYNKNRVVKYLGELEYGYDENDLDVHGNPIYKYLNYAALNNRPEGHMLGDQFLQTTYRGTGTYNNSDGSVNPNGGPRDGMIRTSEDLQWVNDMVAAGYKFNGQTSAAVDRTRYWYGEYIYADNNGDGNYGNEYDRQWTGISNTPKYNFGLQLSAEWKGVDISMLWSGQAGMSYHLYGNGLNYPIISSPQNTVPANARNDFYFFDETKYASPELDPNSNYLTAPYARLKTSGGTFQNNTDFLYNASYIKLKNLQVGYTIPKEITQRAKISNLRVFFSGENLWTITNFPGVDPEIGGVGFGVYPLARTLSGGINLTF